MYHELAQVLVKLGIQAKPETEDIEKLGVLAMGRALEERFGKPDLPQKGEDLAISVSNPKTAALFFDRIWSTPSLEDGIPKDISFYGATPLEVALSASAAAYSGSKEMGDLILQWAHARNLIDKRWLKMGIGEWMPAEICKAIYGEHGLYSAPLYRSREAMNTDLASGERQVLIFAIEGIPIISEADLEWQQVAEFRADTDNRIKLKRLLHWVRTGISDKKSPEEIRDEIEVRLSDYKYALRKHGLKSVIGVLSSVLDPKFLAVGSGATLSMAALGESVASMVGSILIASKLAVAISHEMLSISDIKRGKNWEIAYCHEIQKKFDKG